MSRAAQSWLITQNRLQSGDGGGGCQRLRWDVCRNLREASPRGRPHLAADRVGRCGHGKDSGDAA